MKKNVHHPSEKRFLPVVWKPFTLIELLVVIAMIAILAGMLLPALGRAREMARKTACLNNQKTIGTLLNMYVNDFNGYYPQGYTANKIFRTMFESGTQCAMLGLYLPNHNLKPASGKNVAIGGAKVGELVSPLACPVFDMTKIEPGDYVFSYAANCYVVDHVGISSTYPTVIYVKNPVRPSRTMITLEGVGGFRAYAATEPNEKYAFRHGGKMNVLFLDGRATALAPRQILNSRNNNPGFITDAANYYFWRPLNDSSPRLDSNRY